MDFESPISSLLSLITESDQYFILDNYKFRVQFYNITQKKLERIIVAFISNAEMVYYGNKIRTISIGTIGISGHFNYYEDLKSVDHVATLLQGLYLDYYNIREATSKFYLDQKAKKITYDEKEDVSIDGLLFDFFFEKPIKNQEFEDNLERDLQNYELSSRIDYNDLKDINDFNNSTYDDIISNSHERLKKNLDKSLNDIENYASNYVPEYTTNIIDDEEFYPINDLVNDQNFNKKNRKNPERKARFQGDYGKGLKLISTANNYVAHGGSSNYALTAYKIHKLIKSINKSIAH